MADDLQQPNTDEPGITAYHGSPHDFEQFDMSKIGTGEGAQAYGHGLYFAEAEPVAMEYRDKLTTLMSMRLVIDTLKQKNIPFLMTYMDDLIFDQRWNHTPAVIDLQEYVRPYMINFEGKNFLEWSRAAEFPEGLASHPLEAAHAAAGEYMIKVFDKQNIIVRQHPF